MVEYIYFTSRHSKHEALKDFFLSTGRLHVSCIFNDLSIHEYLNCATCMRLPKDFEISSTPFCIFTKYTLLQNMLVYVLDKLACYKVQYLLA
jgi:hypothetical protein